eukprot:TRINITY_DN13640_c0_g1_i3.p1 TRINITY_DN13640_c0_g1~~TRINITY_DN13640_c0_g1_i3.p1  ORF type:complete len:117 (+),score=7.95 TRINITY_DN13640_c0_g1_i3:30-353(+)
MAVLLAFDGGSQDTHAKPASSLRWMPRMLCTLRATMDDQAAAMDKQAVVEPRLPLRDITNAVNTASQVRCEISIAAKTTKDDEALERPETLSGGTCNKSRVASVHAL